MWRKIMSYSLNRFDHFCFNYLVGLSPVTIGFMIWATVTDFMNKTTSGLGWELQDANFANNSSALKNHKVKILYDQELRFF